MKRKHPRLVAAFGVATMGLALAAPGTATAHGHPHAVPIKQATFNAYATGTYLHTHLLQVDDTRLVNVNVAGSAAAVDSKGLTQRADEMGRFVVNPDVPGRIAWGRGVAIEAGLLEDVPAEDANLASIAGVAEQAAPPTVGTPDVEDLDLDLDPLLYLSLARGEASANWNPDDPCIYKAPEPPTRFPLGPPPEHYEADFGFGMGSVADLELLDLGETDDGAEGLEEPLIATNVTTGQGIKKRSVGYTSSQSYLAGQYSEDGKLLGPHHGLASEVRATLLPITLFTGGLDDDGDDEGTDEITIEFLGPWRLVASAGGVPGSAWIHFGPEAEEPNTPIIRISTRDEHGEENEDILTVEDLVGDDGEHIEIGEDGEIGVIDEDENGEDGEDGEDGEKIADIFIGEGPRAIGDESENSQPTEAADGTSVSAAADVVRIELLETDDFELAEIRLGHMEVDATVPAGGLSCEPPLPPKEPLPRTGDDDVSDGESDVTDMLPAIDPPVGQAAGQETGQELLKAEAVRRQQPLTRAVGLFSAVIAIFVTSGAMLLRRRWSRS